MKRLSSYLPLLLLLFLAPACAPEKEARLPPEPAKIVLLTDTTQWATETLAAYRDSLARTNARLVVSGYPGESAAALSARLPWLLQPGVDVLVYDARLAGQAGADSLAAFLRRRNHPAQLLRLHP